MGEDKISNLGTISYTPTPSTLIEVNTNFGYGFRELKGDYLNPSSPSEPLTSNQEVKK